jgi:hypothetical protein
MKERSAPRRVNATNHRTKLILAGIENEIDRMLERDLRWVTEYC